jgi:hypothetical protein
VKCRIVCLTFILVGIRVVFPGIHGISDSFRLCLCKVMGISAYPSAVTSLSLYISASADLFCGPLQGWSAQIFGHYSYCLGPRCHTVCMDANQHSVLHNATHPGLCRERSISRSPHPVAHLLTPFSPMIGVCVNRNSDILRASNRDCASILALVG